MDHGNHKAPTPNGPKLEGSLRQSGILDGIKPAWGSATVAFGSGLLLTGHFTYQACNFPLGILAEQRLVESSVKGSRYLVWVKCMPFPLGYRWRNQAATRSRKPTRLITVRKLSLQGIVLAVLSIDTYPSASSLFLIYLMRCLGKI
ncbi:hypothetical protein K456DRAFT_899159 [Colletotrichum gloeosporioides 23]|nr:hypothetical protein K456DRAFT_899159 [Colletotrichum gloeosporioides 23]